MKKILSVCLLLLSVLTAQAQSKFTVTGTVLEKGTSDAIMAATVRVLSLPDSALVTGAATDDKGSFTIKDIKKGKYALKVTFIGYQPNVISLDLTQQKDRKVNVGYLTLTNDAKMLKETTVTAQAAQVEVSGDSLVYNTAAYRVAEGSALEELVKKLPGAEVDEEGNIKINGKTVKKILVDGKEFFLNDTKVAMKNIPTNMIEKLKTYDRKSDLARVTGIDDGEEETVLDLTVKKGMNQGWFGNIDASLGTKHRYSERLMLNRFMDNAQMTLIGSANNTGDRGFGGGGGRGWFGGGNGLRSSKEAGFNFATTSDKLETGGSVRFRYDGNDTQNKSNTQNFVTTTGNYTNSLSVNKSSNRSFNANFRLEWKPDSMTNIIFRPSASLSWNRGLSNSHRATFNENASENYDDPISWAEKGVLDADSIYDIIINTNTSYQQTYSTNRNFNGELQYNRRLSTTGRNVTVRVTGGASGSDSEQLSAANIAYRATKSTTNNNRHYKTPGRNSNIAVQATYSEPIAYKTYLQFSYRFNYSYSSNDRQAYIYGDSAYQALSNAIRSNRYNIAGAIDYMLSHGIEPNYDAYTDSLADRLSQYSQYRNFNHTATISFRKVGDAYNFSVGVDFLPQHSELKYKYMGTEHPKVVRNVFNFAPNLDFRYQFDKQTQLRATYRGRTSQPSMTNLLEIEDDSDPLNITRGNAGLKPSFTHNMRLQFNTYNVAHQRGIFSFANLNLMQNNISNMTQYNTTTGVRTTTPENINGNWNGMLGLGFNTALDANKYFTFSNFAMVNYNHNVSYYFAQTKELMDRYGLTDPASIKSKTNQTGVNDRISFGFRKNWFEVSLNGNLGYNHSRNNVVTNNNLDTWNFSYGTEFNFNFNNGISVSTDISESSRRGFSTASMNTNELLWNAQVSYSFLRGKALTISAQWNDILAQRSNISRNISAMMSSDSEYNAIFSYGMIHVIYKLNIFGGKNSNGTPNARSMGGYGPGGYGGRPGGAPGGRPGGRPM